MKNVIEVSHVSKKFVTNKKYPGLKGAIKGLFSREKEEKVAVSDVTFSIKEGEIVGYIGSNGAGKSTTIKMMTGILVPTEGEIYVNGVEPGKKRKENAANIGVVFGQRTQLWWDLPLSESFTILKEIYDVSDEQYNEQMEFLNRVLGLEEFFHKSVRTLSLGQRMRADLGAALLHNPKVLYLDEPTIGLDLVVKDNIRSAIKEINEKYKTTVVLTTHDIGDIEELCNRIIIIDHGKIIYDGTLADLKEKYGKKRKVTLVVKDMSVISKGDYAKKFGMKKDSLIIDKDEKDSSVSFTFDKDTLGISDIVTYTLEKTEVMDMNIRETELSEIVKEIYNHKIMENENETGI